MPTMERVAPVSVVAWWWGGSAMLACACKLPGTAVVSEPPMSSDGRWSAVSTADDVSCGLRNDGAVYCWGDEVNLRSADRFTAGAVRFSAFVTTAFDFCGIDFEGAVQCWGFDVLNSSYGDEPAGPFMDVDMGNDSACAVRQDGSIVCWGDSANPEHLAVPSGGPYVDVSVGSGFACAVDESGATSCWGTVNDDGELEPPEQSVHALSLGAWHACAIDEQRKPVCWGLNVGGEAIPPSVELLSVSAGYTRAVLPEVAPYYDKVLRVHSIGVGVDGDVVCWGNNDYGQCDAPDDVSGWRSVSAGSWHSCGVTADGDLRCWGLDHDGQASPP